MLSLSLTALRVLADALVFGAAIIYLGIIFLGVGIPSHYYHDLHMLFKLLLSVGLISTALFSCEKGGALNIAGGLSRQHCHVSSKFAIVAGLLLLITSLTEIIAVTADKDHNGLLSYSEFAEFIESLSGRSFSEKFKSNMFDLLGGDKTARISIDKLPAVFFPLA